MATNSETDEVSCSASESETAVVCSNHSHQDMEMCQNCRSQSNSANYCKDCFLLLCEKCAQEHKLFKCFMAHEILQMEEFYSIAYGDKNDDCLKHECPLFLYCVTCDCCICQKCRADSGHLNHSFKLVSDYIKEDVLASYDEQIRQLKETMDALKQEQDDLVLEGEAAKAKISSQAQTMIDKLLEYERQIYEKVDDDVKRKVQTLNDQEEDAKEMLKELRDCEQYVQLSLQYGSPEHVLMEKEKLLEHIDRVTKKAQQKNYEPLVEADVTITRN